MCSGYLILINISHRLLLLFDHDWIYWYTLYISLPSDRTKSKRLWEIIAKCLQNKEVRAIVEKEVPKLPLVLIGSLSIIPAMQRQLLCMFPKLYATSHFYLRFVGFFQRLMVKLLLLLFFALLFFVFTVVNNIDIRTCMIGGPVGPWSNIASKRGFLGSHNRRKDKSFIWTEAKWVASRSKMDLFTLIYAEKNKQKGGRDGFPTGIRISC